MKSLFAKYKRFLYAVPCVLSSLVLIFSFPVNAVTFTQGNTAFVDYDIFHEIKGVVDNRVPSSSPSFDLRFATNVYYNLESGSMSSSRFFRSGTDLSEPASRLLLLNGSDFYTGTWSSNLIPQTLQFHESVENGYAFSYCKLNDWVFPFLSASNRYDENYYFQLQPGVRYSLNLDYSFYQPSRIGHFQFVCFFWFANKLITSDELGPKYILFYYPYLFTFDGDTSATKNSVYWDFVFSPLMDTSYLTNLSNDWFMGSVCFAFCSDVFSDSPNLGVNFLNFTLSEYLERNPVAGVIGDGNEIGGDITDQVDVFLDYEDNISSSLHAFDFSEFLGLSAITYTFGQMVGDFFDLPYMTTLLYLSVILGSLSMLGGLGVAVSKRVRSRGDTSAKVRKK